MEGLKRTHFTLNLPAGPAGCGSTSSRSINGHTLLVPRSSTIFVHNSDIEEIPAFVPAPRTVIYRIWPAVLMHTLFAAVIVLISEKTRYNLSVPNVMLTVLGLVVGFGISYRANNGFDRYQDGRQRWSDIIKNSRTLARLIWEGVPERIDSKAGEESAVEQEMARNEKKRLIGLVEAFGVATKHALRGEEGIFYEDLYKLLAWLLQFHEAGAGSPDERPGSYTSSIQMSPPSSPVLRKTAFPTFESALEDAASHPSRNTSPARHETAHIHAAGATYNTFNDHLPSQPLLPAQNPPSRPPVLRSLILGYNFFARVFGAKKADEDASPGLGRVESMADRERHHAWTKSQSRPRRKAPRHEFGQIKKYHPDLVHGEEGNLPLTIINEMSAYLGVLERRGTVTGPVVGGAYAALASLEDALTAVEKLLTTPLPVVYSVHLRQTVWIYLLALPVQLVGIAGFFTIPVLTVASFLFLGFLAAGEELSQPFGFDACDIDLDLLCYSIRRDLHEIMTRVPPSLSKTWLVSTPVVEEANERGAEVLVDVR